MDTILQNFVQDYASQYGYSSQVDPKLFEHFVNHTVVARLTQDDFDVEKISPGESGDLGLDGIAILISSHPVTTEDEIDFFLNRGNADVEFVFTQAKTSRSFNAAEIANFIDGVLAFFGDPLPKDANAKIREIWNLKQYIYKHTTKLEKAPACRCLYATTGEWVDDAVCRRKITEGVKRLEETSLIATPIKFFPLDADELKRIYRALSHRVTCEIEFDKNTVIPQMPGVSEAYLGLLPCEEYLKLIVDDDGDMRPNLFYNNVRDYQGETPVNREIASVLKNPTLSPEFALLNNGVTIVARSVNRIGNKFKLTDFQIVNGCQTSNVLYECRHALAGTPSVPVKLIVTDNPEVTNRIIRGTNRQTEVKPEAFESLSPFHRILEDYYNAMARKVSPRLYYERRSKQYLLQNTVKQHQVVTLPSQCTAFLAMFLDEPHSCHHYYGGLLSSPGRKIFDESHQPHPYFLSSLTQSRIDLLFNRNVIARTYRGYKHQIAMQFRHKVTGPSLPPLRSRKIEKTCDDLLECLLDSSRFEKIIKECVSDLASTLSAYSWDTSDRNPPHRRRDFTHLLVNSNDDDRVSGTVVNYNIERGFGFIRLKITTDSESDLFVHHSSLREKSHPYLKVGDSVNFEIIETPKGKQANNVVVVAASK